MGERKAVNKYYPPDWDPSMGGLDKYHGVHPLRERASKLHLGIMVIRFEMPFNMWCGGCNSHIGMGVRYNAEKKKIGMYYTTPLWQFRMKCHLCDNYIEIHTDPKNFDYLVVSGGRRKEEGYEQDDAECAAAHEPEERKRLGTDPMYKIEYKDKDEKVVEDAEPIIDKLQLQQDAWKDDYSINQTLRKRHRDDIKDDRVANKKLKEKMGLGIKMLPTTKTDRITSALVRFTTEKNTQKLQKKTDISAIFTESKRRTLLLNSLKGAGVKCKRSDSLMTSSPASNSLIKVRRRSADSSSTSSSTSSITSPAPPPLTLPIASPPDTLASEPPSVSSGAVPSSSSSTVSPTPSREPTYVDEAFHPPRETSPCAKEALDTSENASDHSLLNNTSGLSLLSNYSASSSSSDGENNT